MSYAALFLLGFVLGMITMAVLPLLVRRQSVIPTGIPEPDGNKPRKRRNMHSR